MKKILLIALACMLINAAVGCDMKKESDTGMGNNDDSAQIETPANDSDRADFEGAVMEYVSSTESSLTVELRNETDSVWQSGNMRDYTLECERDGVWYTVKAKGDFANTMELMLFVPGQTLTHTFDFADRYGALSSGKYRVVKSWWANTSATREAGEFYLTCEFTVE